MVRFCYYIHSANKRDQDRLYTKYTNIYYWVRAQFLYILFPLAPFCYCKNEVQASWHISITWQELFIKTHFENRFYITVNFLNARSRQPYCVKSLEHTGTRSCQVWRNALCCKVYFRNGDDGLYNLWQYILFTKIKVKKYKKIKKSKE